MHRKVKDNVRKVIATRSSGLRKQILETLKHIAETVGCTLGPGGLTVLIERQEEGMPPFATKDGVTVIRAMGYHDEIRDLILLGVRDASVRTAMEAGDGTTTAIVLAQAIVERVFAFSEAHPEWSPQAVVRRIADLFEREMLPFLRRQVIKVDLNADGVDLLAAVAKVSANGDEKLAEAVMRCFVLTGDEGHVLVTEKSGPSEYIVEPVPGYPLDAGYEQSCGRLGTAFLNDQRGNRIFLESPNFLLYNGRINTPETFLPVINALLPQIEHSSKTQDRRFGTNWVIVATGFSEETLAWMMAQFSNPASQLRFVPQIVPQGPDNGYQHSLLRDLAGVTGSVLFDPQTRPIPRDPKNIHAAWIGPCLESYEASRAKALILGQGPEQRLLARVKEVQGQVDDCTSDFDARLNKLRLARLTGGVAKIVVSGGSNAEIRERKDRVDDALCAIRGALKDGCLPGAGWSYLALAAVNPIDEVDALLHREILAPAFQAPTRRILLNAGLPETSRDTADNINAIVANMRDATIYGSADGNNVYDAATRQWVRAAEAGLLDSAKAVTEALRSALSISLQYGTLGAAISFPRDEKFERDEAAAVREWNQTVSEPTVSDPGDEEH